MTDEKDELRIVKKYVIFFDICSSTAIIEDLIRLERQKLWRNLLIRLKRHLQDEQDEYDYIIYKFIGDGWVLLFDLDITGVKLFSFLAGICNKFDEIYT